LEEQNNTSANCMSKASMISEGFVAFGYYLLERRGNPCMPRHSVPFLVLEDWRVVSCKKFTLRTGL
jgi:hypothetical protein